MPNVNLTLKDLERLEQASRLHVSGCRQCAEKQPRPGTKALFTGVANEYERLADRLKRLREAAK